VHLSEEVMIAVPLPALVQRCQEEVLSLEHRYDRGRVGQAGDGIAQRTAESAENRGPGEKLADLVWLMAEHVLDQEIDDEPVVAGELADELTR
jgi:hypothetical protein